MALHYLLLVSLFSSHSLSYDNGLRLWKDCPSMQSTTGSKGSHFEITIQMHKNACKMLLSKSDIEKSYNFPKRINGPKMQLTVNKERANITWNVQYKTWCHRRIFMLDVEYRVKNSERNGAYVSYWCFQYNLSKGEPKQKERVTFYFDCIRTIPDREAYLIDIKLWSLPQNWPFSFRTRRSVQSDCSGISCTTSSKKYLEIGPIKPTTNEQEDPERRQICQCWNNSSISLKQNTDANDKYFSIVVDNPNPYARLITVKVYEKENYTFPVFSQTSRLISPVENVIAFLTPISCENMEGTFTPMLRYDCEGRGPSMNYLCQAQNINGPSIYCPVKKKHVPPTDDIPHFAIVLFVLAVVFAVMIGTLIVYVCKGRKKKPENKHPNNRLSSQSTDETETISLKEVNEVEVHYPDDPNVHSGRKQIMVLYHTDSTTSLVRKDCVNLIKELLTASNIDVLGFDRVSLFKNWVELAERASKDDITEFLIIISRELVSLHKFYMTPSNDSEAICTKLLNNKEYFCCAVLKALRDRYFLPGRASFRIHILSLEYSDNQLCKQYVDTYSSFMIVENYMRNTFTYCCSKYLEDTKSFVFDETVLPSLLKRLNETAKLPENTRRILETVNTETSALKLKIKLSELFQNQTQQLL
ncbi:hypothetical protein CHS0354_016047 [Potamilus streckersoni]|uniref:SEFIR domain-containing protein n=1 Tax=Potamilus streckersoni TaxID=2493646 RepID=A0AAE0T0Y4_9BIVA|nr:hypothetical protein CHS0354_016047 [Potamilus streckersoni]